MWNANIYSKFLDARTRPARDLLAAIPNNFQPSLAYDLGCGPGNSTILLKDRWPNCNVVGLDSSEDMLNQAKQDYPNIQFQQQDIANFTSSKKCDVIYANASLQWLDQHVTYFPKLINYLNKDGYFAVQMPNNFHNASHQVTVKLLQNHKDWQKYLDNIRFGELKKPFYDVEWYYDLLNDCGLHQLQIWETEYFQEMSDHAAIFAWVQGTGLRPILTAMNDDEAHEFKEAYVNEIANHYNLRKNNKVIFPFRRFFMVGCKA